MGIVGIAEMVWYARNGLKAGFRICSVIVDLIGYLKILLCWALVYWLSKHSSGNETNYLKEPTNKMSFIFHKNLWLVRTNY